MASQIIFLGTSGDASVTAKQLRTSGGIILQIDDLQLHLDPGPGALNKAKEYGINLRGNTAVLVSHAHINHCNDLNAVIDAMTLSGLDKRGVLIANKTTIQGSENYRPYLTKYHQDLLEKIIVLEKSQKVAVELVEIHALSADHTDPDTIGFKLFCPRFTLSYTSDTKYNRQLVEEMQGSDILILNVPRPGNKSRNLNLDTESAIKIIEKVRPKLAVITHFGLEMLKADPIIEAREIQKQTGIQTIAAKDGLVISPENYAAKSPQIRLSGFVK
jgi:ribonuclease BN (tRNA processing enzyme)